MDLSIITVSWKVREKLRENLQALYLSQEGISFEVIVVDNDSQDGTLEMLKNDFPEVVIIANSDNRGFGAANNQGLGIARSRKVLFLNPDMRVKGDTLMKMKKWMDDNPQAAIAGCQLVDEAGNNMPHVRRFPGFSDQLAIVLKLPHLFPSILDRYLIPGFDYAHSAKVDSIRGAFFMVDMDRIEKIKAGRQEFTVPFFDERYFLWFEEVDYCRQIRQAGGEVWYCADAQCIDHVGQSFNQVAVNAKQNYMRDSMLKYFRKWHRMPEFYALKLAWPLGLGIVWLMQKMNLSGKART